VPQVKKEKRECLEEMVKMDFLEKEGLLEVEVFKGRLEKMGLQECLDLKDQWVTLEALDYQDKRETREKMLFTNLCLGLLGQGVKGELLVCKVLLVLRETLVFLVSLALLDKLDLKEKQDCQELMVYQEEMDRLDRQDKKERKGMDKKGMLERKETEDLKDKKVIQDPRE